MSGRVGAFALASVILASCGGGGGSGANAFISPPITASPTSVPTSSATSAPQATTTQVAVTIPGTVDQASQVVTRHVAATSRKKPAFVSPGSMGVAIAATPQGGGSTTTQAFDVSSGSPLCTTGSPRTCTLPVSLSAGTYSITLTIYNESPVSGSIPTGASVLGVSTISQTIVANQSNTIAFTVQGVIAGVTTSGGVTFGSLPANGTAQSYNVALVVTDASGNAITSGTYSNPIAVSLTESGGSGHAYILKDGANAGASATLTSATDTLAIHYDGGGSSGYTTNTTITASGASSSSVQVSPMYVTGALAFTGPSQTDTLTVTEAGAPSNVAYSTAWSCTGFSKSESGTGASHTVSFTSPTLTAGSTIPSFSCGNPTVSDNLGSSMTPTYSGSIPTSSVCAAAASGVYLGNGSAPYEKSSGTHCTLSVSGTSGVTVYNPSNPPSLPGTASVSVSEANDANALTITASACSGKATSSASSITGSGSLTGTTSGSFTITGSTGNTSCTMTVTDGTQTSNVPVTIDPGYSGTALPTSGQFTETLVGTTASGGYYYSTVYQVEFYTMTAPNSQANELWAPITDWSSSGSNSALEPVEYVYPCPSGPEASATLIASGDSSFYQVGVPSDPSDGGLGSSTAYGLYNASWTAGQYCMAVYLQQQTSSGSTANDNVGFSYSITQGQSSETINPLTIAP